ncbi:MAG: ribonuclease E/G, partial [Alphaproteobacteria bacterium]
MAKKMLIDATHPEETRVVVVDGNKVEEFDFESASRRQLAGNIYLAKVTRVEPSLQAAFVDYGGNRHGFLAFSEIHPDYYQIPVADREALLAEEREAEQEEAARGAEDEEGGRSAGRSRRVRRSRAKAEAAGAEDAQSRSTPEALEVLEIPEDAEPIAVTGVDKVGAAEAGAEAAAEAAAGEEAETPAEEAPEVGAAVKPAGDEGAGDGAAEAAEAEAEPADGEIEEIEDEATETAEEAAEIRRRRRPRRKYKIQEVIKVRQIMLVQVVKEERGNKGAALTTYLSLAGRYCVLMPNTARGGGISRKITNAADRKRLKEIAAELTVPEGAGLIIRTAGAKRTKAEIKRDYEYLLRLWEQIRELTLKSVAPAQIYEEGNLIKRAIRDLYSREIEEVLVEGEEGYRTAKDFMKMIMPSHAKNVKLYDDPLPLFARYNVESYLAAMFNPVVQLPSGGYIVIGVTEALVAIDVNSGRSTKEGSIEDTALKTNLEAAEEIARQLKLRDLAGLIVIDFIDMDERKNNAAVEKRFKEKLKSDRARIQVGRISGFGLLEMSRQRLRPGMLEATTMPCPHCHGTGLQRSHENLALSILRQLEEEGVRGRSREVLLKVPVEVANFLVNEKRERIAMIEERFGMAVRIQAEIGLTSPDFEIERFKSATRPVARKAPVVSIDLADMPEVEDEEQATAEEEQTASGQGRKKRRRRRRRKGSGAEAQTAAPQAEAEVEGADEAAPAEGETSVAVEATEAAGAPEAEKPAEVGEGAAGDATPPAEEAGTAEAAEAPPKRKSRKTTRSTRSRKTAAPTETEAEGDGSVEEAAASSPDEEASAEAAADAGEAKPKKPATRRRSTRKKGAEAETAAEPVAEAVENVAEEP